jgi:hypothetical protein
MVIDIKKFLPETGKRYFLDANVWILILKPAIEIKAYEKAYISFFESLITTKNCKIAVNRMLVSEVYNAYMRNAFDTYKNNLIYDPSNELSESEISRLNFKEHYRATSDHDVHLKNFRDDFIAYREYLTMLDDEYREIDPCYIVETLPPNTDFNDYYFFEVCYTYKVPFVTNDKDFHYSGIEIITNSHSLLKWK